MPDWIQIPGWLDLLDIAVVAAFGWLAIRYFRRTRARAAFTGLAVLSAVYLLARGLDLRLTSALFQSFLAVVVIVLVVVFQDDLRRVFERLGSGWRGRQSHPAEIEVIDSICRAVTRLAATRTGALIVLPRREPLDRHLDGGVLLAGRLSEPLLLSLFDAGSPGHDGAVLINGPAVERFAIHLPLSANRAMLGQKGTRHAAALGLAERCDAICIVVSEERGTVSVARDGEIRTLARPDDLIGELHSAFVGEPDSHRRWDARVVADAMLAAIVTIVLWMVLIPGSDLSETTVSAAVDVTNLPSNLALESVAPESVDVTLRGLRRDLVLAQRSDVTVRLDAYLARLGRRTFSITTQDVRKPDGVSVVSVEPLKLKISVVSAPEPKEAK